MAILQQMSQHTSCARIWTYKITDLFTDELRTE
jgi:hypothetical protein